ncbi:MAG: TonB-dependent receptor plug [Bacteroidetes bacterium]|nr:TonB-dependent receptor plug [Bacteroidota bacterium]
MKVNIHKILLISFILLLHSITTIIYAQNNKVQVTDSVNFAVFDSIAPKIEKNNHIKLFYKSEWFKNRLFRVSVANLPLDNCINALKRLADLNCIILNSTNYVFVPIEIRNYSNQIDRKGVLTIGDMHNDTKLTNAVISGKVIDTKTGNALKNVSLSIDNLNITAYTDKTGTYKLTIPTGEYLLRINYQNYKEDFRSIKIIGNGIVDFELFDKTILLPELVVSDKSLDINLMRNQMSIVKLNAKAIKELPFFLGEKDIIKSITLLPGIQSTGEFGTGFFVRGGSLDQNLILVEDVPLFNSAHVFGLNSALNPDGVISVTLLKAGIPAKYGERASSIMDIKLANNADKLQFLGGIGLLDSRLNLETPLFNKKLNILVGGRTSYSNWLLHAMPDADLKNSSANFYDYNTLLTLKINSKNNLSVFGYFSNDHFKFANSTIYKYDNTLLSAKYNHSFSKNLNSTLIAGYSRYRSNISESDTLQPNMAYKINFSTNYYTGKLNFTWKISEKHSIDFGYNSILYDLQPGTLTPISALSSIVRQSSNKEKGLELAEYLSDNISLSPDISTEIGLRMSHFAYLGPNSVYSFKENAPHISANISNTLKYENNEFIKWFSSLEPRLSLRYAFDKLSSVKFSYNRISQYINLISNTAVMSPTDIYKLCSPNVKPLVCNQFAIGYFRNFYNNAIETSIEMYYKKLNNIIEYRNGATLVLNKTLEADLLNASGNNYGIEFYIKKNTGHLTGWLSYTYSRSMRHTTSEFESDQINENKYFSSSFDIPHNLVINTNYHLSRRWRLALIFNYNSGKPITLPELKYNYNGKQYIYYSERNKYRLPDYNRLDLSITFDETLNKKQKWKGSWTLSILNVYGQKNPYSAFYKYNTQIDSKYYRSFNLYNLYIIERPIPTITYNFSF